VGGDVLEAALLRAGQTGHDPVGPILDKRTVLRITGFLIEHGQGQHGRGGVDVAHRQTPLDVLGIPGLDVFKVSGIAGLQVDLHHRVHGHALGPLPSGEVHVILRVARAAILRGDKAAHDQLGDLVVIHRTFLRHGGFG